MQIELTPEQSEFVRRAVETGRVGGPDEAVQEALALWVGRERARSELLSRLDAADLSLNAGAGIPITAHAMAALAEDVMARCTARIAKERA